MHGCRVWLLDMRFKQWPGGKNKPKHAVLGFLQVVGWVGKGAPAGTLSTVEGDRGVVADTSQCPGKGEGEVGRGGGGGGTLGWFVTTAELDHSDPN